MSIKNSKECYVTISFGDEVVGTLNAIDFTFVKRNKQEIRDKEIRNAKNNQNRQRD